MNTNQNISVVEEQIRKNKDYIELKEFFMKIAEFDPRILHVLKLFNNALGEDASNRLKSQVAISMIYNEIKAERLKK